MSRRTVEASKAIRLAWEREQELVQEGKGTRDWTEEQQKDILNPDIGKAYDDKGRAFEGQHMKSAAEYPEYQGNPDNIQFLTRDEHLDAHKGNWHNPTNWYYNPVTKEYADFGDGEIVPCKIIELNNPVVIKSIEPKEEIEEHCSKNESSNTGKCTNENSTDNAPPKEKVQRDLVIKTTKSGGVVYGLKKIEKFIVEHPVESLEIAGVVVAGVAKVVSSIKGSGDTSSNTYKSSTSASDSAKSNIGGAIADIVEKANRASPRENDVSGHKQRYHTKNGIIWKDKSSYHRGGKLKD